MRTTLSELKYTYPFQTQELFPFYALIEVASNREGPENSERLYDLLGSAEELIVVSPSRSDHDKDGVVADSEAQSKQIWKIREEIASAYIKKGYVRLSDNLH
jgi:hypothetical protein